MIGGGVSAEHRITILMFVVALGAIFLANVVSPRLNWQNLKTRPRLKRGLPGPARLRLKFTTSANFHSS